MSKAVGLDIGSRAFKVAVLQGGGKAVKLLRFVEGIRGAGKSAIAAHTATMVPVVNGVLNAIKEVDTLKGKQVALRAVSTEQTAQLHALMLGWSGLLDCDLASFDSGAYVRDANLTFDVVQSTLVFIAPCGERYTSFAMGASTRHD